MPAARSASLRSVVLTTGAVVLAISILLGCPSGSPNAIHDGRSPGSRVLASGHLPGFPVVSWPSACRLQLRGSRGLGQSPYRVPFDPREGHRRPLDRAAAKPRQRDLPAVAGLAGRCIADHSARPDRKQARMPPDTDENARHKAKMANRKAVQDAEVADEDRREGPADRPYRQGQGQVDGGLRPGAARASAAACAAASCSSARAPGRPASAPRIERFGDQVEWHTLGEGFTWETPGPRRATSPRPSAPGPRRAS